MKTLSIALLCLGITSHADDFKPEKRIRSFRLNAKGIALADLVVAYQEPLGMDFPTGRRS